ncbi:MAG: hypothetical protein ACREHG_02965, partial [Candidatus Saccharimonadales bacterium]
PEVFDDTPEGYQVFKNFLEGIAGLEADATFRDKQLRGLVRFKRKQIAAATGDRHVIAFVSGGVDSSVAMALAVEVIPPARLHAFFIDNGFMRDEDELVIETLQKAGIEVQRVDAVNDFEQATISLDGRTLGPLVDVTDPETKRKIIGKTFIDVQNRLVASLNLNEALLLQGTNAADRIESGHSKADSVTSTIKTHHNQVKEVRQLKDRGLLLEPIDDLFKDEVRELGRELGLPDELVERQPFPGPGLAIRIIAAEGSRSLPEPHKDQSAVSDYIANHTPHAKVHLLPIRSVGVGGDERSHLSVAAVEHGGLKADQLSKLGADLPAHFREIINRVIYALGPAPLNKHSITATRLAADVRSQLRHADRIVFEAMRLGGLLGTIKQFPVVLLPLSFDKAGKRSIV